MLPAKEKEKLGEMKYPEVNINCTGVSKQSILCQTDDNNKLNNPTK